MTSERTSDGHAFCCDKCGDVLDPPKLGRGSAPRDWHESWEEAKRLGWKASKGPPRNGRDGEWRHHCPTC